MEPNEIVEQETQEIPEPWYKGPIKYIMMTFLLLLIVMWYFPKEAIKLDSNPDRIPTIEEVLPQNFQLENHTIKTNLYQYIKPNDPTRLEFEAVSDNGKSDGVTIEVVWDGIWTEGRSEIKEHLIVKEIKT